MNGLINRGIQHFILDLYGPRVWEAACEKAGLDFANFESLLQYEDSVTEDLVSVLCVLLRRDRDQFLEDYGTFLVSAPRMAPLRHLLSLGGEQFEDFLHSLEDVKSRVSLALPSLDFPDLTLFSAGGGMYRLELRYDKPGYGPVFLGLLRGMADVYSTLVLISLTSKPDRDVFHLTLIKSDHTPETVAGPLCDE